MTRQTDLHSVRILIVDDCSDTASVLCDLLVGKGFQDVSWVTDRHILSRLRSDSPFGLLLLDMHMPDMSGLDVMRHMRNIAGENCRPVIAFSGDQRYRLVARAAGAGAFLLKPFDHQKVEDTIHDVLSEHRQPIEDADLLSKILLRKKHP